MNRIRGWTVDVTQAEALNRIWGLVVVLAVALLGSSAIAQQPRPAAPDIPTIENPLLAQSDAEAKILSVLDDLDKNERKGMMNVPLEDGRLLRLLTESIGAKRVVEIGTSNGYSGIWFCLALRKTGGHLVTHGEETLIRTKVESQAMTRITEFYPENKHGYGTRRECGKGPVGVPCRAADL